MRLLGLIARGAIIWLVPFILSVPLYDRAGELVISYAAFKSIMVLTLTWTTIAVNLIRPPHGATPAGAAGIYLLVNLLLDALVVIPLTGLTWPAYIEQIGLVYLIIPTLTVVLLRRPLVQQAPQRLPG